MTNSVYPINKGVGREIEFKGFRAQYIFYLAAAIGLLILLFALLYLIGVNSYLILVIIIPSALVSISKIQQWSDRYGTYGLMKLLAARKLPKSLRAKSRAHLFFIKKQSR